MAVITPKMYYVVTKALAHAMQTGATCKNGTVYGIFTNAVKAFEYRYEKGLSLVSTIIEL